MKHHLTATAAVLAVLVGGTLIAQGGGGPRPRLGEDRVLFGKDSYQIDEFPDYWRVFETEDEYFDYYRDYHASWQLYGMGLPDDVLKKLYFKNALKLVPGLAKDRFPA